MKILMLAVSLLALFASPIYAQMSTGQGGGMMGNGWGWGMGFGSGWVIIIIIAILVFLGVSYLMMKRK